MRCTGGVGFPQTFLERKDTPQAGDGDFDGKYFNREETGKLSARLRRKLQVHPVEGLEVSNNRASFAHDGKGD
jgi:hypothetical protein